MMHTSHMPQPVQHNFSRSQNLSIRSPVPTKATAFDLPLSHGPREPQTPDQSTHAVPAEIHRLANRVQNIKNTINFLETELLYLVDDLKNAKLQNAAFNRVPASPCSDVSATTHDLASPLSSPSSHSSASFSSASFDAPRALATIPQAYPAALSREEIARSLATDPILDHRRPLAQVKDLCLDVKPQLVEPAACREVLHGTIICFHCDKPCQPMPRITRSDNRNSNAGRPYVVHETCEKQINFLYFTDVAGWQGVKCDCGLWCIPEGRQRHIDPRAASQAAICPKRAPMTCGARFARNQTGQWLRTPPAAAQITTAQ